MFLWVSEKFGFRSSEFFWKYPVFSNSQKFGENSLEIISEISLEISLEIISCFWDKKTCFWGFWGQSSKNRVKNRGFWTFQKLRKMTLKLNFGNRKKLVPTWKPTQMISLKFGMQGLTKQRSYPLGKSSSKLITSKHCIRGLFVRSLSSTR